MNQPIFIMLASFLDREDIVRILDEAIQQYKQDPIEDHWRHLSLICYILLLKITQEHEGDNPFEAAMKQMKELENIEKIREMFNPNKS